MVKKILAVFIPIVVWGVLWGAGNAGLRATFADQYNEGGAPTSTGLLLGVIAFSVALSLGAGILCAIIASRRPGRLVMTLAIIQFLIGVTVQTLAWDLFPVCYHAVFLLLVIPAHILGGKIGTK